MFHRARDKGGIRLDKELQVLQQKIGEGAVEPIPWRTDRAILEVLGQAGVELIQAEIIAIIPEVDGRANSGKNSVGESLHRLIKLGLVEKVGERKGYRIKKGP